MIRLARPDVQIIAVRARGRRTAVGQDLGAAQDPGLDPGLRAAVLKREVAHRIVTVADAEAVETARALARSEGIFCGISSGRHVRRRAQGGARRRRQGSVILAMLPDTGERYLSTVLFEGIAEGGDPEP